MQAEHALTILENAETKDDRRRMQLYAAIAASQAYMAKSTRDTLAAWRAALEIAETLGDAECQLRALWGIWVLMSIGANSKKDWQSLRYFPTSPPAEPTTMTGSLAIA